MFDFVLSKDGKSVLERVNARGEVVIAALQLLCVGETLTVKISSNVKREKTDE